MAKSGTITDTGRNGTITVNWSITQSLSTNKFILTMTSSFTYLTGEYASVDGRIFIGAYKEGGQYDDGKNTVDSTRYIFSEKVTIKAGYTYTRTDTREFDYNSDGTIGNIHILAHKNEFVAGADADIPIDELSNGHMKVNGSWKLGYLWKKISGSWKRCIIWKKINGIWKKGV